MDLSTDQLEWLRFANAELSPRAAHAVLDRFGSPEALFAAPDHEVAAVPELTPEQFERLLDPARIPTVEQCTKFDELGVSVITRGMESYPRLLVDVIDRPPALFLRGDLDERDQFSVAIVGTRSPSPYGREIASMLARDLAEMGFTIVSGGAVGIDTVAHTAALRAGGRTLVILGCGLDVRYPAGNQQLFKEIVTENAGAILTEFPIGATPEAWRFPARNRVISGISMGVIVVEAGRQSGALITAGTAGEQGRDVMAVPGNIDQPMSAGPNALIRDGAALITCAEDVVDALGVLVLQRTSAAIPIDRTEGLPDPQRRLLALLSLVPRYIDILAAEAGMSISEASAQLTLLELEGLVHRQPGGCFIRSLRV